MTGEKLRYDVAEARVERIEVVLVGHRSKLVHDGYRRPPGETAVRWLRRRIARTRSTIIDPAEALVEIDESSSDYFVRNLFAVRASARGVVGGQDLGLGERLAVDRDVNTIRCIVPEIPR